MNVDLPTDSRGLLLGHPLGNRFASAVQDTGGARSRRKRHSLEGFRLDSALKELTYHRGKLDLCYTGDGHLMTVAPTGSGKGRSVIIPNLLRYRGPMVITDPKGENYAVTARARGVLHQAVYKLNPFRVMDGETSCFNPFNIFDLPGSERETDSQMLADLLALDNTGDDSHRFWDNSAFGLLSGVIAYIASLDDPAIAEMVEKGKGKDKKAFSYLTQNRSGSRRTFSNLLMTLHSDDVVYNLAVVLDDFGSLLPKLSYREIASFLQRADKERSGVLSTVNSYLKAFNSGMVLDTFDESHFSLADIRAGVPISIYLIVPPDKLKSHKALLRLWVGTILRAITSRQVIPKDRTLLVLDECAQLGTFPFLESAITLCRGYGLQTWTFWQDLGQLKQLYKTGWETMVNNCEVLQMFGANNYNVAKQLAEFVGIEDDDIRGLSSDEQIVVINGVANKCSKFDYKEDSEFAGSFAENPYYRDR